MSGHKITPEDLLAGGDALFEVLIPENIVFPPGIENETKFDEKKGLLVKMSPVTIGTFQLIMKAAKSDPGLIPLLMIEQALSEPKFNMDQVKRLNLGVVNFLIENIRKISGLDKKKTSFSE